MRVVLVGPTLEREDLRRQLRGTGLDVVGEFGSLEAADASDLGAEAYILGRGASTLERATSRRKGVDQRLDGELDVPAEALTAREVQVLELLAEGLSNKTIAQRLGISDQTVKFHVASISGKLGAVNRTDAVRRAVRHGLITL
jgi:DNA-binding NarL/FixJ family response regulator